MDKKIEILKSILGECYSVGDENLFYCPMCNHHKQKLSINIKKDKYKCWVCDFCGVSIRSLIKKFGKDYLLKWDEASGYLRELADSDIKKLIVSSEDIQKEILFLSLPDEFNSLVADEYPLSASMALSYLKRRGITKDDIFMWKIGYAARGEYADRIIIPSFNSRGNINYYVGRSYSNNFRKYLNPPVSKNDIIFNELYLDFKKPLILVEGIFDAIVAGENAVPILGSTLPENGKLYYEIVKNNSKVYIALDADAKKKELRIIESLVKYGIEVFKIDTYPYADPASMPRNEFQERKQKSVFMSTENYLLYKIMSQGN